MTTKSRLLTFVLAALALNSVASVSSAQYPVGSALARRDSAQRTRSFGTIDGLVSDTNLVPLHAAFVSILGTPIRVGTGPNGRFRIVRVPAGQYLLIVKRVGYRPVSSVVDVATSDTLRVSYTMAEAPQVTTLGTVVVTEPSRSERLSSSATWSALRCKGMRQRTSRLELIRETLCRSPISVLLPCVCQSNGPRPLPHVS